MPLPTDPNTPWPPEEWREIYELYREHDAWYSGDPVRLSDVYSARISPTPRGRFWATEIKAERRTMLHIPIAGDIAATSANLLFSEPPKFYIPESDEGISDAQAAQDRLAELVDIGDVISRLIEGAETAAALGGVFIGPVWDDSVADYPILRVAQADAAIPEFRWGILQAVTLWRVVADDGERVWRHLERHEPGVILHGLYVGDAEHLGRRVDINAHPETQGLQEIIELPPSMANALAIRYVPNMRPNRRFRGKPIGQSDYAGSEAMMDALDEVWTSWLRDIRLGRARLIVPEEYLERRGDGKFVFDVDQEVFTPLDMAPTDGQGITAAQFAIRTEEHAKTALDLLERIVSAAGYSPQSFGLQIFGRAESGTALRIRERKSLMTKQKKERYWKSNLADVLEQMLIIDREVFGRPTPIYRPRVDFDDSIADDPKEIAESVDLLARAKAASIETRVRMLHPDWTDAEVKAEVETILAEEGMRVPDPMQIGLP